MSIHKQGGKPLLKIPGSSFCPPSLLAWPIKALTQFALSFLWPSSSASVLALSSLSLSNSSSFIETNRLEATPGRGDDDSWLLTSTQSEEFSFTFQTSWYSIGCNRTQFPPGLEHKSPLKSLRGLLNWDVQIQFDFGSVAMKMFPLWLTCSACRSGFKLKGIQIEQIWLLTISGGPGMDQPDQTTTDTEQEEEGAML